MNTPFSNIIAVCKLKIKSNTAKQQKSRSKLLQDAMPLSPDQIEQEQQEDDMDLKYLNFIDLDQISLSYQELKLIDKFYIRKNFALALTKKKEPIYWGQLVESKDPNICNQSVTNEGSGQMNTNQQQFIDILSESEKQNENFNQEEQKKQLLSKRISFFKSIKIIDICCNDFAAHFLSEDGMLYSMGKDQKKYGILGMGSVYEISQPHPNNNLIDFRLSKISMGLSHCAALTTGGQLYTWGTGQNGQLCHSDDTMFSNVPKQVQNSKNMNIQQIYCSSYYTLVINNKGQLQMFGTLKGFAKFLFDSPSREKSKSDLFQDISKNSNSRTSDQTVKKFRLDLGNEVITKVSIAEKSFIAYCQESHNLYFVNDKFEPELILRRELKRFQFLNGQRFIVAQDTNNILIVMSQEDFTQDQFNQAHYRRSDSFKEKWQVVKEFNLIQRFNTQDVEMLPQDTSITTKKAQQLQLLAFITQTTHSKQLFNTFNKRYYKSFLTKRISQLNQNIIGNSNIIMNPPNPYSMTNDVESSMLSESKQFTNQFKKNHCSSPYSNSAFETCKTRNKLKQKIDSIFGATFSARKGRSTSSNIKERAKKLHQSLSPIQRFPIINNLCEIIKQQKLNNMPNGGGSKSPPKYGQSIINQSINDTPFNLDNMNRNYQDQIKSPQYNLLLQSLNIACQLTNMGNLGGNNGGEMMGQSQKQIQFLSKADKIRQELNKKVTNFQQHQNNISQQNKNIQGDSAKHSAQTTSSNINAGGDMIEIASPEMSRTDQINIMNLPLQIEQAKHDQFNKKYDEMPLQTGISSKQQNNPRQLTQNLSCIMEDRENSTIVQAQNTQDKDVIRSHKSGQKLKSINRNPSINIPSFPHKLTDSNVKQKQEMNQLLNIDTISEISGLGRDSMHRFSQASDITNTNNYKILVMNARNVIEKKILQHLMVGFMAIKYHQTNSLQSFQLQSTINYSHNLCQSIEFIDHDRLEQGFELLLNLKGKVNERLKLYSIKMIRKYITEISEKKRSIKKLVQIFKQKEEQMLIDSMRKIQLSIRFKKLQRLNINLLFNCFNKLIKRYQKSDIKESFRNIQEFSYLQRRIESVDRLNTLLNNHFAKKAINQFKSHTEYCNKFLKGLKLLKKTHTQIQFRKNINRKSQALYNFKKNVINFQILRTDKIAKIFRKQYSKKYFRLWHQVLQKRKTAIQQAIFLKMFIIDKIKQAQYYAIVKMINYCNINSMSQTKKSQCQSLQSRTNLQENCTSQISNGTGLINISNNVNMIEVIQNENFKNYGDQMLEPQQVIKKLEFVEKSIQNDDFNLLSKSLINDDELDIEETQLEDGDYYYQKHPPRKSLLENQKSRDMPFKKGSGKEFSFEKNENPLSAEQNFFQDNNMTAHFNKFNLMSKGKDSSHLLSSNSGLKDKSRPHYHCHYANEDKVAPEAFTLDPSLSCRQSTSIIHQQNRQRDNSIGASNSKSTTNKKNSMNLKISIPSQNDQQLYSGGIMGFKDIRASDLQHSHTSKLKMSIQDEISPTNNVKNYQRQTQFNKNYEQSDPFELPQNDNEFDFPKFQNQLYHNDYAQFIDKYFEQPSNVADDGILREEQQVSGQFDLRYSFKNVVPFNPTEDTPPENKYLRQQQVNLGNNNLQRSVQQQVFESKKGSNASSCLNNQSQGTGQKSTFINNYFKKLEAQNSAKNESKNANQQQQQNLGIYSQGGQFNQMSNSKNKENNNNIIYQQQQLQQVQNFANIAQQQQQMPMSMQSQMSQPLTQASFVTNNNHIDLMHFNSHSDASFVFFDDNFWRESGISSASRMTTLGKLGPMVNQSFGQNLSSQKQQQLMNNLARQSLQPQQLKFQQQQQQKTFGSTHINPSNMMNR